VWSERGPLRYERLTWPEVRRAAAEERVALVPVATLEDHGPHLPVDTDLRIVTEICERAATEAVDRVVLLPAIPHGYDPHHMDFPGAITIGWDTFTRYCADVGRSLAHHGFRRMLFLNGHGSNQNLVEMAARLVMVERPEVLAAAAFYLASPEAAAVIERVRDSTRGGMAHACELETSIYLAIDPDAVAMDLAVDERGYPEGEHAWLDWSDGSLKLMPWWSAFGGPLPEGGCIGVPAPASPWENRSDLLRGVEWWQARGYRVKLADGIEARDSYVAGDAKGRARDLEAMFADPEVDVVQCLTGGFGSMQLLPHLDFDLVAEHPKAFLGYSDITALHVALRQRAGLATFYGPHLWTMGARGTSELTRGRLLEVLRGDGTGPVPSDPDDPYVRPIRGGRASGPLAGGDLWLLLQTMGTPWEVELDGAILFFEDVEAPPWYVDGMLTQLGQAGKLAQVVGVVVGEMDKFRRLECAPG